MNDLIKYYTVKVVFSQLKLNSRKPFANFIMVDIGYYYNYTIALNGVDARERTVSIIKTHKLQNTHCFLKKLRIFYNDEEYKINNCRMFLSGCPGSGIFQSF